MSEQRPVCAREGCHHVYDAHFGAAACFDCSCKGYVTTEPKPAPTIPPVAEAVAVEPKKAKKAKKPKAIEAGPAKAPLYELAKAHRALKDNLDVGDGMVDAATGELTPYDKFEADLLALEGSIVERATAARWVLYEFQRAVGAVKGELEAIAAEQDRLRARRAVYEKAADRLKDYIRENVRAAKLAGDLAEVLVTETNAVVVQTDTVRITVSEPGSTLDRDTLDVKALPREWVIVEQVTTTTPKFALIEAALKRGEVIPGASLKATKAALRIS